jgi:endogenous inhibitor of DNA gyrase (YacG/DUF329 family)
MRQMAAKCDMCGKMVKKFSTISGLIVCSKSCLNVYLLRAYLLRLEERRGEDEAKNKAAYAQAREMSGWLAMFQYGNAKFKKLAAKAINSYMG